MPGYFDNRASPSVPLPPVGSPLLPLTPRLPIQPPGRKKGDQLAPLRVPKHSTGKASATQDKLKMS